MTVDKLTKIPEKATKVTGSVGSGTVINNSTGNNKVYYLPSYVKSSSVKGAESAYKEWKSKMPAAPKLTYTDEINKLTAALGDRKFSYTHLTDPAYIAQKNALTEQGRLAMEDTAGIASAASGGYANSYAASAANQAYNSYIKEVQNVIPELYDAAYNRYRDETEALYDRIDLLTKLDNEEWSRYGDVLDAYYDEGKLLLDELSQVWNADYKQYSDYYKLIL